MLTNSLKDCLKNNDLFSVDIHEIAKGLILNKNEASIIENSYIAELKKYIEESTPVSIKIIDNTTVKEIILSNRDSYISITQENKSINIIFSAYISLPDEHNSSFDFEKILSISTDPHAKSLFYFIVLIIDREEEIEFLNYEFEAFKKTKENEVKIESEKGIDIISDIIKEIILSGKITRDFFDIVKLTTDNDTKIVESIFTPVFGNEETIETKNINLKKQLSKELKKKSMLKND